MIQEAENKWGIDSFALKMIAAVTMFIDHYTYIFLAGSRYYMLGRCIGRIAFPIFCFQLVEGYFHTRNKTKYALRIAAAGVISEFAFDLAFYRKIFDPVHQNVMWTLLIGFLVIWLADKVPAVVKIIVMMAGAVLAEFLQTDYGALGVIIIFTFYIFRERKLLLGIGIVLETFWSSMVEGAASLALIPIFLYNGKQGPKKYRYWFYLFYPGHLFLLYFLSVMEMYF